MEVGNLKPVLDPSQVQGQTNADKTGETTAFKPLDNKQLETPKENREKTEKDLQEAVDKLNKTAMIFDRSLRFQVHGATHRTMVSVVDIANDKVIRQIPNEEVLDLVAKMEDYMGLIFDKKA
ncbi:MAG: flagellar protein FlaG [Candidatus Riflebacteria bacterium]|nr:flagellar protein FlaG [Candidatus Riflebacteria bacterium]